MGHFWVIFDPFWDPFLGPFATYLLAGYWVLAGRGPKRGPKYDPKWVIFDPFLAHFGSILGPYFGPLDVQNGLFWPFGGPFWDPILGPYFGPYLSQNGPFWAIWAISRYIGQNRGFWPKYGPKWPILGYFGLFWPILGHIPLYRPK